MELGGEDVFALREGGRIVGGLFLIRMGQFFGGRRVPCGGIAAVGVAPEGRGRGAGARLMSSIVHQMRTDGMVISSLFPAICSLYRRVGYEIAGEQCVAKLDLARVGVSAREPVVRKMEAGDRDAVRALYGRVARWRDGAVDREGYMWARVEAPRFEEAEGYVVEGDAGIEGYVYLRKAPGERYLYDLQVSDMRYETPRAAARLLSFLGDHSSMAQSAHVPMSARDPLYMMLPERTAAQVRLDDPWMLRVVDVKGALEARGYRAGVCGELTLRVRDDLVQENDGAFTLRVADGRGVVTEGGGGGVALDVRALAALYTGFASAEALRDRGALEGDEGAVGVATALFAGPTPEMSDKF